MRKINLFVFLLVAVLVFSGCSKKQPTTLDNSGSTNGTIGEDVVKESESEKDGEISLTDLFLPDGSKAHYLGEGNEFAELDVEVTRPFENYVVVHENNGGSLVRHIYKIEPDKISILDQKTVELVKDFPSQEELDALIPTGVYLKKPLKIGTTFDTWSIVEMDTTVETPYKKFDHAIVIEMKTDDFVNRKYFVEGFGEVKRESIMQTDDGEFVVTSSLQTVDK
ncbi:hypothetical protein I2483_01130 [Sporosarcina sp. E16_3]|uniref:hypothetical protein n=1 Tax=Sporosarcina sp. E16_3 TaxID=2789293 RepID=UPI001A92CC73|nr:hypothetical protein [Sporosarcina sp. E16_3]MBO0600251.1 hypothetical protein [Sporosarcina sp. E16_3]